MNDRTHPLSMSASPTLAERAWLRRYARRRFRRFDDLVPPEELESLADLGFVLAARRFQRGRQAAFTTYARCWVDGLLRRAVHQAMERERRRGTAPPSDASARAPEVQVEAPHRSPETLAWLRRTLERLPPQDRALVTATVVEGRSARSLAQSLGVSPRQAQRLTRRALARLRAAAGVEGPPAAEATAAP